MIDDDILNLLYRDFGIDKSIIELSKKVMKDIKPFIQKIEQVTEYNQIKVIKAMTNANLSDFHLNDSTGYGYGDMGMEVIEEIFKSIFRAEDALVRPQIVSGTHAIALCLYGILRPGDELLSVTGAPYDTLHEVLLGSGNGSLKDFGVKYSQVDLIDNKPNYKAIARKISKNAKIKMVLIQRSRGYSLRSALNIDEIKCIVKCIKDIREDIICFVDNCYGEFVEIKEPTEVGADLCAGSLIKNPGGGIAPTGGYIAGKKELIEQCCYRLYAPGLGKDCGPSIYTNRLTVQGVFLAPLIVGETLKGSVYISRILEKLGFKVSPRYNEKRSDIVVAASLGSKDLLINFCQAFQKAGPVDSMVLPEPSEMPGYNHRVIMAGGSFIQGSSIELSVDAPIREPYVAYIQGGLSFYHVKLGVMLAIQNIANKGFLKLPIKTDNLP